METEGQRGKTSAELVGMAAGILSGGDQRKNIHTFHQADIDAQCAAIERLMEEDREERAKIQRQIDALTAVACDRVGLSRRDLMAGMEERLTETSRTRECNKRAPLDLSPNAPTVFQKESYSDLKWMAQIVQTDHWGLEGLRDRLLESGTINENEQYLMTIGLYDDWVPALATAVSGPGVGWVEPGRLLEQCSSADGICYLIIVRYYPEWGVNQVSEADAALAAGIVEAAKPLHIDLLDFIVTCRDYNPGMSLRTRSMIPMGARRTSRKRAVVSVNNPEYLARCLDLSRYRQRRGAKADQTLR